jgi:hypothetical protein
VPRRAGGREDGKNPTTGGIDDPVGGRYFDHCVDVAYMSASARPEPAPAAAPVARRPGLASRLSRSLEQNGTLVMAVAAFAIVLITRLRTALAADGWMALLSGRVIAQHGLPSHDTLTVWAHGRRWVDQQWLAQLTLYGLDRLGGLPFVLLVHAFLVTLALGGAAALALRHGGSARSATWVALPVLVAYWPGALIMRPQSFAYPLFVAVLWILLAELRQPSRRVYLVLPLLVLWANLHGSVVVGAAVVSAFALAELTASLRPRTVHIRSLVLLVTPWLCVLASPYATSLPHYYRLIFSSGFGSYVTEWAPTTLTAAHAPVYLLALGGLWLFGRTGDRATPFEKLAFVGLTLLAFDAVRNAPWLALFSLVVLPRLLDALRAPAVEPKRLNRLLALAMLVLVGVATLGVAVKPASWFTQTAYPPSAERAAVAAAGAHGRVFANERYADWLVFEDPQLAGRIAYDSRFELLTARQLGSVIGFRNLVAGWHGTVRGYPALVLDRQDDARPIAALVRTKRARVVTRRGPIVVLRQP